MGNTTLVIGGCRSGKSARALALAEQIPGTRLFVATCEPGDDVEMLARVAQHRRERDSCWQTVESPVDLPATIADHGRTADVILIDCLTVWIGNLLFHGHGQSGVESRCQELLRAIVQNPAAVILVANEVGAGIVPENPMARQFRDLAGFVSQQVARAADRVVWMVAGIPVTIKGKGDGTR